MAYTIGPDNTSPTTKPAATHTQTITTDLNLNDIWDGLQALLQSISSSGIPSVSPDTVQLSNVGTDANGQFTVTATWTW